MKRLFAFLTALCPAGAARADDPAWATLAHNDLQAIHDVLRDNHPGPVDPENPGYRDWLEGGLARAFERATSAGSYADYARALRFYTNGFRDGHTGIGLEISPEEIVWPGFVVGSAFDGAAEVVRAEPDSGVRIGDRVTECDGRSLDALMKERVDPYFWNVAIPQDRGRHLHQLFHLDPGDAASRPASCRFSSGQVILKWRRASREAFARMLEAATGRDTREPSLRQLEGLWVVSLPTLAYSNDVAVARIRTVLAEMTARAPEFRRSTVVLDVRGNHGGNSAWGEEVASALWGRGWVDRIEAAFDKTVDWRASDANIRHMTAMVEREKKAGLMESAACWGRAVDAMKTARAQGKPLARFEDRPKAIDGPAPPNPVTGRVFFLTDGECASACLDFADLVRRLPNVTHVGLPTSADAIYIDNTYALLPSGLAGLGYSLKVYRNRVRKNNEWYEPETRWPGGRMTDEVLFKWLKSLP